METNGCRSRSSSGSPPWPGRSTPASRCGSSHSAPGCSLPAAAAPSPVGCAGAGRDYKRYYYLLGSVGRKALAIAGVLLRILLKRLPGDGPGTPLVSAIDDSPTKRYGPHVEGAGKHHNPTPGPAGPFLYGHVWVGWPAWSDTRSGERSPCRPLALVHPSQRCRLDGGLLRWQFQPSWSWPPPRSSGWSSSWGPITRRSGW